MTLAPGHSETRGKSVTLDARELVNPDTLFLPVSQAGEVHGEGLSSIAIYNMLQKRAAQAGAPHVSPHDLRRSFVVICTTCGHHNVVDRQRARSGGFVRPETFDPDTEST